jgi:transcription termination/antitermination protein NusA
LLDTKQFLSAIKQIAEEKGISEVSVLETIEAALAAAYKRDYGKKGQIVRAKLDPESGDLKMTQVFYVVEGMDAEENITGPLPAKITEAHDEEMRKARPEEVQEEERREDGELKIKFNPEKHVLLEEAKKKDKNIQVGDELIVPLETKTDFGRIAAQTAKQVVIQRLREAERDAIFTEFKQREGELVGGIIQRREGSLAFIDLGKTNGLLTPAEQVPTDNYRIGQRYRFLILRVEETPRGPVVLLSRSHPKLIHELFRVEVPEIDSGVVEVKSIAREAGSRTKVAVSSKDQDVDPIGSLVGQKGVRVQTVINELSGEKIDIIMWSEDPKEFIGNALSPAKILSVQVVDDKKKHALVEVSEDQFSLAIGKKGQNVRLAAKLTGWKIDVRSPKENLSFNEAEGEEGAAPAKAKEEVALEPETEVTPEGSNTGEVEASAEAKGSDTSSE